VVNWHFDATHKHISESDGWAALAHNGSRHTPCEGGRTVDAFEKPLANNIFLMVGWVKDCCCCCQ
jgi:hypothetical protein